MTAKTNAMRILDSAKIPYCTHSYDISDGQLDGCSVASKISRKTEEVFKTLVAQGISKQLYVFVIPVDHELSLKKAAKAAGEKSIAMLAVKDLTKNTGYVKGGCSPIGMKKLFPTFLANQAQPLATIIVSAGKIGSQIELPPAALAELIHAQFSDLCEESL